MFMCVCVVHVYFYAKFYIIFLYFGEKKGKKRSGGALTCIYFPILCVYGHQFIRKISKNFILYTRKKELENQSFLDAIFVCFWDGGRGKQHKKQLFPLFRMHFLRHTFKYLRAPTTHPIVST